MVKRKKEKPLALFIKLKNKYGKIGNAVWFLESGDTKGGVIDYVKDRLLINAETTGVKLKIVSVDEI